MSDEESRAGYFLGLLDRDQWDNLQKVKQSLEVPRPHPTEEQLKEAEDAERS
jgi:hypothetical protein